MRPSKALQLHREEVQRIVEAHHAKNARVFGSVLTGEDTEDSDLDLLVDTTEQTSLLDIARIQNKLQKLLRVSVDVLTPKGLPEKWRAKILKDAQLV
jgi:uncharacterized protein